MPLRYAPLKGKKALRAQALIAAATAAWRQAYAPYSRFKVGAALMTVEGEIFSGCNTETANYDGGHAEEGAIMSMVSEGYRKPVMIVSVGCPENKKEPWIIGSCGKCRQWLQEYASLQGSPVDFIVLRPGTKKPVLVKMADYLPWAFGPADVIKSLKKYRKGPRIR